MGADTSVVKKKHKWNSMAGEEEWTEKHRLMEGEVKGDRHKHGRKHMVWITGSNPLMIFIVKNVSSRKIEPNWMQTPPTKRINSKLFSGYAPDCLQVAYSLSFSMATLLPT